MNTLKRRKLGPRSLKKYLDAVSGTLPQPLKADNERLSIKRYDNSAMNNQYINQQYVREDHTSDKKPLPL